MPDNYAARLAAHGGDPGFRVPERDQLVQHRKAVLALQDQWLANNPGFAGLTPFYDELDAIDKRLKQRFVPQTQEPRQMAPYPYWEPDTMMIRRDNADPGQQRQMISDQLQQIMNRDTGR